MHDGVCVTMRSELYVVLHRCTKLSNLIALFLFHTPTDDVWTDVMYGSSGGGCHAVAVSLVALSVVAR